MNSVGSNLIAPIAAWMSGVGQRRERYCIGSPAVVNFRELSAVGRLIGRTAQWYGPPAGPVKHTPSAAHWVCYETSLWELDACRLNGIRLASDF